jgi:hypothetical protein
MKTFHCLFAISSFLFFFSCIKHKTERPVPAKLDLAKLTDSGSYTVNGITYICNELQSDGGMNAGVNLDTSNGGWKYDPDTLQYSRFYTIGISSDFKGAHGGNLKIRLVQKFAKNELPRNLPGIVAPASDTVLYYPKGNHPYAVDFSRFNTQSGVVLEAFVETANESTRMSTYSDAAAVLPTAIANDSQKDSKFEVINVYMVPGMGHILEAKFSANLFDKYENVQKLENGYIRIHVD